jgi:hypothetical protein
MGDLKQKSLKFVLMLVLFVFGGLGKDQRFLLLPNLASTLSPLSSSAITAPFHPLS